MVLKEWRSETAEEARNKGERDDASLGKAALAAFDAIDHDDIYSYQDHYNSKIRIKPN